MQAHAYALAVRGQGAPVVVEGTVRTRPLLRGSLVKSVAIVLVVAVWAALGIIAIPRIAALFSSGSTSETATGEAGAGAQPSGSAGAAAGEDGGAAGGAAAGGAGAGGAGGAGVPAARLARAGPGPAAGWRCAAPSPARNPARWTSSWCRPA